MTSDNSQTTTTVPAIFRLFFKGLATIIPIALTLLIVFWLAGLAEKGVGRIIQFFLPENWYITGMGLVTGIVIVIAIGLLSQLWLFRKLIDFGEAILDRMPLIKSVFRAIKDFVEYFSGGGTSQFNQCVIVRHPEFKAGVLGFITREDFDSLPFGEEGEVAVYMPMSYQIGGYTVIMPKEWCEPVDLPFEDALRLILTASVSRR